MSSGSAPSPCCSLQSCATARWQQALHSLGSIQLPFTWTRNSVRHFTCLFPCSAPVPGPHWLRCIILCRGEAIWQHLSSIATCLLCMRWMSRPSTCCKSFTPEQGQPCCLCTPGGWWEGPWIFSSEPAAIEEMRLEEGSEWEEAAATLRGIAGCRQEWDVSQTDVGVLPFSYPSCWICCYGKKSLGFQLWMLATWSWSFGTNDLSSHAARACPSSLSEYSALLLARDCLRQKVFHDPENKSFM